MPSADRAALSAGAFLMTFVENPLALRTVQTPMPSTSESAGGARRFDAGALRDRGRR